MLQNAPASWRMLATIASYSPGWAIWHLSDWHMLLVEGCIQASQCQERETTRTRTALGPVILPPSGTLSRYYETNGGR